MDDTTLARLEHANMLDWLRVAFAQVPGATVRFEDGVAVSATGLPAPFFNQVVIDDGATPAAVAAGVTHLRERGAPFCVVLRRDRRTPHLRPLMDELGLVLDAATMPGMALGPIPAGLPTTAPGLDIRLVGRPTRCATTRSSPPTPRVPEDVAVAFIGDELWKRDGASVYTGYADGRPVTSGFSLRSGDTLGIFTSRRSPTPAGAASAPQ